LIYLHDRQLLVQKIKKPADLHQRAFVITN
jgi:hypothetical protein